MDNYDKLKAQKDATIGQQALTIAGPFNEGVRQALIDMIEIAQEQVDSIPSFVGEKTYQNYWDRVNKARGALANWEKYHGV